MTLLEQFFTDTGSTFSFTREQASNFAKNIAGDLNPLHDVTARRFCVPGDLLFAVVLSKGGISQRMRFDFSGMVSDGVPLLIHHSNENDSAIQDESGKEYLKIHREGDITTDKDLVRHIICKYVEFSGHTYPDLMVPLLAEKKVMLNPDRPLAIYQSMTLSLDRLDLTKPNLESSQSTLAVNGKKGSALLQFNLIESGEIVGHGEKHMVIGGLMPYVQSEVDRMAKRLTDAHQAR